MNLNTPWRDSHATSSKSSASIKKLEAHEDIVIEDTATGWVGAIISCEKTNLGYIVNLENNKKQIKAFPIGFGFLYNGKPIEIIPPIHKKEINKNQYGASGSKTYAKQRAQIAKQSRIWVEGKHDAQLIEKVWGEDLRYLAIVVEPLHGIDNLLELVLEFKPTNSKRLGILVDHLVPNSKEARITNEVLIRKDLAPFVNIQGHPYVDVWQAIKPHIIGMERWPEISRDISWKKGILNSLNLPCASQEDIARGWLYLLSKVTGYKDLEYQLLNSVESIIDFVSEADIII